MDLLLPLALMAVIIGLLLYVRPRPDPTVWRYYTAGQMSRKVNGQWQYRPATEQEQRDHEAALADEFA